MPEQHELSAAAAAPVAHAGPTSAERLAAVAAEQPESKLVLFHDLRNGTSFIMSVPPTSPWHELLPPRQESFIRPK